MLILVWLEETLFARAVKTIINPNQILKGFAYETLGFKLYFFSSVAAGKNAESIEKRLHSQANQIPNSHEEFIVILFRIIVFYRTVMTGVFASHCRLS